MRERKFESLPFSKSVMFNIGVYPIIDHYYEPMFNPKYLYRSLRLKRNLPGINLNVESQLKLLSKFKFSEELIGFPIEKLNDEIEFCYKDGPFPPADAEYLYNMIRVFKPGKIIEIGSGHSTLMAKNAIKKNIIEDSDYTCKHICIEPYESDWLRKINVEIVKERVEKIDISFFEKLEANDILFIDSSHIIRPQGDVLFEYLEILPILKSGVLVHIHDIFTPEDYPCNFLE
ncbi:MAG: class I SAM-dependent methyltransferase [Saprospiraceae bacterium]|nr:class I SAM-dependent methyltransferase [Saprospiraceae bacterium]